MKRAGGEFKRNAPFVRSCVPLAPYTSFRIGGTAEFYAEPETEEQVRILLAICKDCSLLFRVMGAGTNLLVDDDGVDGLVIRTCRLHGIEREGGRVTAGVGAPLPQLIDCALGWKLGGLTELAGIPGTVGGALATNAGTRHGSIGPAIETVTGVDPDGRTVTMVGQAFSLPTNQQPGKAAPQRLEFDYRTANLRGLTATSVTFALHHEPACRTGEDGAAGRIRRMLAERRASQPRYGRSAGCIFKNPPGDSAGRLIDAAGLKGKSCRGAQVSTRHANCIINQGGASSADVIELMQSVRQSVRDRFGVVLEPEIQIWQPGATVNCLQSAVLRPRPSSA